MCPEGGEEDRFRAPLATSGPKTVRRPGEGSVDEDGVPVIRRGRRSRRVAEAAVGAVVGEFRRLKALIGVATEVVGRRNVGAGVAWFCGTVVWGYRVGL